MERDRVPLPTFNAEACERGECCRCPLCCTVLDVGTVPDPEAPEDITRSIRKRAGERCPHLVRQQEDGPYGCAVHHLKNTHPHLKICAAFDGRGGEGGYALVREKKREFVLGPRSERDVTTSLEWLREGLLDDIDLHIQSTADLSCAMNYLNFLTAIPHALFEKMNMRGVLRDYARHDPLLCENLLDAQGIAADAGGIKGAFYREYVAAAAA